MQNHNKHITRTFTALMVALLLGSAVMGSNKKPAFIPGHDTCKHEIPGKLIIQSASGSTEQIVLRWHLTTADLLNRIVVMRKEEGKTAFEEIKILPGYYSRNDSLMVVVRDNTIDPYKWYHYYLQPYNFCEDIGIPSDTTAVKSVAKEELPFATTFTITPLPSIRSLKLKWAMSDEMPIKTIFLYRSGNPDGPFQNIAALPAGTNAYVDVVPIANENFFYYVVAETYFGVGIPSVTVFGNFTGQDVPIPPQGLVALPSDSGVIVSWDLGESFILGYHVFRKSGNEDTFRDISGRLMPDKHPVVFLDKDTLTPLRTYTYQVVAVSDGFLESEPSNTTAIRASEGVVPPPSHINIIQSFEGQRLLWDEQTTTYPWVEKYCVVLYYPNAKVDTVFAMTPKNYVDLPEGNELLKADVFCISFMGNKSEPAKYTPKITTIPIPAHIRILDTPNGVQISWDEIIGWEIEEFFIYRESETQKSQKIESVPFGKTQYTDTTTISGVLYGYSISAKNKSGKESQKSKIIIVQRQ